jgi:hypothetical protein
VPGIFGGTCTGTQYLGADGKCRSTPDTVIGLFSVNSANGYSSGSIIHISVPNRNVADVGVSLADEYYMPFSCTVDSLMVQTQVNSTLAVYSSGSPNSTTIIYDNSIATNVQIANTTLFAAS